MKANRSALERFAADDSGVSEAVGYLITFGISTVILVTSLNAFTLIRNYTEDIARDRAGDEVAAQVAFMTQQALRAGEAFPEAHANFTLTIPRYVSESSYRIELNRTTVFVNMTSIESARAVGALGKSAAPILKRATADVLCAGSTTQIIGGTCSLLSTEGEVTITYGRPDPTGAPDVWGVYIRKPFS